MYNVICYCSCLLLCFLAVHLKRECGTHTLFVSMVDIKTSESPSHLCRRTFYYVLQDERHAMLRKAPVSHQQCPPYRMVICLAIAPPFPTPPSREVEALTPALRSKTFQNFKLSSAAAVASICPSGLRQLYNTLLS